MRKWVVLGLFVVAVAAVLVLARANLNGYLNRNKTWIAEQAQSVLGRQVAFDAVRVSLSGGLGIRLTNLRIADDASFSQDNFVRAETVKVLVRILPALQGRYEVRRVVLDTPELTVIRSAEGFNFDSIGRSGATPSSANVPAAAGPNLAEEADAAPAAADPNGAQEGGGALASLLVGTVNVSDGLVRYIDRTATPPTEVLVRRLNLKATDFSSTTALEFELSAALLGAEKSNCQLSGSVGPLPSEADMATMPLDLKLAIGPFVIDELEQIAPLAALLPPELLCKDPIEIEVAATGAPGHLAIETSLSLTDADLTYATSFHKPRGIPLRIDLQATQSAGTFKIEQLNLVLAKLAVSAKGQVLLSDVPTLEMRLDIAPSSLEGLDQLSPGMADLGLTGEAGGRLTAVGPLDGSMPKLTGNFTFNDVSVRHAQSPVEIDALSGTLALESDTARISRLKLTVGGSVVEANMTVKNFRKPLVTLTARSPEVRPSKLGAGEAQDVLREIEVEATLRPGSGNRSAVEANVRSAGGLLRGMEFQNLDVRVTQEGTRTIVESLKVEAFEGTIEANARVETRDPESPQFETTLKIRQVALGPMVKSQRGENANLEGRLRADLTMSGSGKEWESIRDHLVGQGGMDVQDGLLKDVNIAESVLSSLTGIAGLGGLISPPTREKYPGLFSSGDTPFDKLSGTIRIADGQVATDDLTLAAPDYSIRAEGTVGLDTELDLEATLRASERLTADLIASVKEARYLTNPGNQLEIPFRLTGSPPKVKTQPDKRFITKALTRAVAGTLIDQLLGGKKTKKGAPAKTPAATRENPKKQLLKGLEGFLNR